MTLRCKNSKLTLSILSIVLVAVVTSGIPLVKVHSHDDASFGHSHGIQELLIGFHHEQEGDEHDSDLGDAMHAHEVGTPMLTLIQTVDTDAAIDLPDLGQVVPPQTRPPENIITPLHRPPIA